MTFNLLKYTEIQDFIEKNTLKNEKKAKIIAISKSKPLISVREAINNGIRIFGENRVQEAKAKFSDLKKEYKDIELHLSLAWHELGHGIWRTVCTSRYARPHAQETPATGL